MTRIHGALLFYLFFVSSTFAMDYTPSECKKVIDKSKSNFDIRSTFAILIEKNCNDDYIPLALDNMSKTIISGTDAVQTLFLIDEYKDNPRFKLPAQYKDLREFVGVILKKLIDVSEFNGDARYAFKIVMERKYETYRQLAFNKMISTDTNLSEDGLTLDLIRKYKSDITFKPSEGYDDAVKPTQIVSGAEISAPEINSSEDKPGLQERISDGFIWFRPGEELAHAKQSIQD
jgi:hypothetical protein